MLAAYIGNTYYLAMDLWREGLLVNSELGTGNVLCLELHDTDIEALADPAIRYSMNRFKGLKHGFQTIGWTGGDKVHVTLSEPVAEHHFLRPVSLSLDPGGDLYYTIWLNESFANIGVNYGPENIDNVLEHDPSEKLQRIGITAFRCLNLQYLADELKASGQLE